MEKTQKYKFIAVNTSHEEMISNHYRNHF